MERNLISFDSFEKRESAKNRWNTVKKTVARKNLDREKKRIRLLEVAEKIQDQQARLKAKQRVHKELLASPRVNKSAKSFVDKKNLQVTLDELAELTITKNVISSPSGSIKEVTRLY
jgi:hypothetical protein